MKKLIVLAVAACCLQAFSEDDEAVVPVADIGQALDEFVSGSGPESYVSGMSVTNVRSCAFMDNRSVKSIELGAAAVIGSGAFRGCSALEELRLPALASLERMQGMFSGCRNLRNVYLGSVDFPDDHARRFGFPWQAQNPGIVFHFRNGDFDRFGNRLD